MEEVDYHNGKAGQTFSRGRAGLSSRPEAVLGGRPRDVTLPTEERAAVGGAEVRKGGEIEQTKDNLGVPDVRRNWSRGLKESMKQISRAKNVAVVKGPPDATRASLPAGNLHGMVARIFT